MNPRGRLRKLWTDHVLWTRQVIVSVAHGLPDLKPTVERLLKNQDQIGAVFVPIYGMDAGKKVAGLFRVHIKIAAEILTLVKEKKNADAAIVKWKKNADEIAKALSVLVPALPESQMREMMHEHLNLTLKEVLARHVGDYAGDIVAFDTALVQVLKMSDMLSAALIERTS